MKLKYQYLKCKFWSCALKVTVFLIGVKVKAEGSLSVQSKTLFFF